MDHGDVPRVLRTSYPRLDGGPAQDGVEFGNNSIILIIYKGVRAVGWIVVLEPRLDLEQADRNLE
jgi:sporulation protein YlmC with PRC-barrel domain